ncbi:MAG: rhomboid family intramembrane serine protease [Promethearchaeota archaeon]
MPFCEHCGNEIGYLPFNCNYCGGTFCKQHRLPENHECSFELKHKPAVSTAAKKKRQSLQEVTRPISQDYLYKGPRQLKKYLKRQEKERKKTRRMAEPRMRSPTRPWKLGNGTLFIMLMIIIFSALEIGRIIIEDDPNVLKLSQIGLYAIYIWRIITTSFIYTSNLLGFFFLFIMIYFLRFMGKLIEVQYGTKFFLKFYFLCVGLKILIHAILMLPFALIYPEDLELFVFIPSASAAAAIFGLIALLLLPMLNREITGFMYFFPVRTKGKTFLLIMVLFILLPGLLYLFLLDPFPLIFSISDLGGLLAAYLIVYQKIRLKN